MEVSGYTLEYIAKRLEGIARNKDFAALENELKQLEGLIEKYPEDKKMENYYVKLKEISKSKEIQEFKELIKEMRKEAHWRQIGSASGTSLPYRDYRKLEKL